MALNTQTDKNRSKNTGRYVKITWAEKHPKKVTPAK